jgi:magnesium transporter
MYYYIKNTLEKAKKLDFKNKNDKFVAVLTSAE